MNGRIVGALIAKDLSLYFRNRLFTTLTVIGFVFFLAIYFLMPSSVDERLEIGLYAPVVPPALAQMEEEGLEITRVDSEVALREAVTEGRFMAGLVLPASLTQQPSPGQRPRVTAYFAAGTPQEIKDVVSVMVQEMAFVQSGQPLAISVTEEVLGPDMLGMQIPPRDRLRPLLAILILLTETMALSTLIGEEIGRRTIRALLVTPMTVRDLFAAKGTLGVGMAFGQAVLFLAIVGGITRQPVAVLITLFLGAVMVTGIAFLIGSTAEDLQSAMPWLIVAYFPLMIPAIGIVFPGTITGWVKLIPSYYLVDTVHRAANFGSGLGDVWQSLLILLAFDLAIVWVGIVALRRRFV